MTLTFHEVAILLLSLFSLIATAAIVILTRRLKKLESRVEQVAGEDCTSHVLFTDHLSKVEGELTKTQSRVATLWSDFGRRRVMSIYQDMARKLKAPTSPAIHPDSHTVTAQTPDVWTNRQTAPKELYASHDQTPPGYTWSGVRELNGS